MGLVEGKTCIVTGAAGSIGLATVEALLNEGARVMLVDLNGDKLQRVARGLDTNNAAFVAADVTRTEDVRHYVDETVKRFGKIDVLFSNAGNDGPLMPITEYPEELFDRIIATHVRGCFLVLQIHNSANERRRKNHHHVKHCWCEGSSTIVRTSRRNTPLWA